MGGPSWRPEHSHDDFELSYIEQGSLDFRTDRGAHGARLGECIVIPPGMANQPRLSGRITQLHLSADRVREAREALTRGALTRGALGDAALGDAALRRGDQRSAAVTCFAPDSTTTRLMSLLASCARELPPGDPQLDALVDACTLSVLPRAAATRRRSPETRIRTAIAFIEANLRAPIAVADMAEAAGLSRYVFLRQFKAQTGTTPYRYLLERRLDCARELLLSGDHSVLSVALELEFKDPGRFSRAFRQRFAQAPSQLLKK